jgi:hypothetical protein
MRIALVTNAADWSGVPAALGRLGFPPLAYRRAPQ